MNYEKLWKELFRVIMDIKKIDPFSHMIAGAIIEGMMEMESDMRKESEAKGPQE